MSKLIGYVIALIGLAIIALSFLKVIPIPSAIPQQAVLIAGLILIIIGVFLTLGKSSSKIAHASEEVPIYEGEGKKKKIVGYKRAK